MSAAISSNIPRKEEKVCFISEGEEDVLVKKLLNDLEKLSDRVTKFYVKNSVMFLKPWSKDQIVEENLTKEFDNYLRELIILGYNTSNYDLNLIKPKSIEHLVKKLVS